MIILYEVKSITKTFLDLKAGRRTPSAKRSRINTATKRPGSTKSNVSFQEEQVGSSTTTITEKVYAFTGFNLGDDVFHVSGDQSYLFPCNGSIIKIEKFSYVQENTTVQISVIHNGDVFIMSFINPCDTNKDMEEEKNDTVHKIPSIETSEFGKY